MVIDFFDFPALSSDWLILFYGRYSEFALIGWRNLNRCGVEFLLDDWYQAGFNDSVIETRN